MGANYTSSLLEYYKRQNRSIEEQVLNFNFNENLRLYNYLLNNYKPQNRYYLYDFFYDNCATRIKDVCNEALNYNIKYNIPEGITNASFRTYIHEQVYWNSWGRLGIDLALGAKIDQPTTPEQAMFLPKYIYMNFLGLQEWVVNHSSRKKARYLNLLQPKTHLPLYFGVLYLFLVVLVFYYYG